MMAGGRLGRIGWALALVTCTALYAALHVRVNAVKSEVRLAERRIIALQNEKLLLETEFQTRANQRQLAAWNNVEFGYSPPGPDQYLEGERQLAQFGQPRAPGAPAPIIVASAPQEEASPSLAELISPPAMAAGMRRAEGPGEDGRENLSARLTRGPAKVLIDDLAGGGQ